MEGWLILSISASSHTHISSMANMHSSLILVELESWVNNSDASSAVSSSGITILLVDLSYGLIDPRVRVGGKKS